jgi:hypothetical protein
MIMLNSDALIPAVGKWQIGNRKPVNPIKDIWITSVAKCGANLLSHKILRLCAVRKTETSCPCISEEMPMKCFMVAQIL